MKPARLFSLIVLLLLALYGAVGFYFLPDAGFNGDLTRIGMLPERLFGWRKPQPAIDPKLMQQASWQDADVLVVGDSFSEGRVWQTVLTGHGLKVRTEDWGSIRAVCDDFEPWLKKQGFKGRFVIFEIVERNAGSIHASLACKHMSPHSNAAAAAHRALPLTAFDPDKPDYSGRFSVGLRTAWNTRKYEQLSSRPGFHSMPLANGASVVRLTDGCKLFSHRRCQDVLFLTANQSQDLNDGLLDDIRKLNTRLHMIKPLWVIAPNKSTVYLYPHKQFWNKAEQQLGSPNLLRTFRAAVEAGTVDLYFGNNTHLSPTGYLLMGKVIYRSLEKDGLTAAAERPANPG